MSSCISNKDCSAGYECVSGTCLPTPINPVPASTCKSNFDCSAGYECVGGECLPSSINPVPAVYDCRLNGCKLGICNKSTGRCQNLCESQDAFDNAFYHAAKYSIKKEENKNANPLMIYGIVHLIFMIWGILLAFRSPPENRVVHITLAMVFGPAYVLAYYLNAF